MAKEEGKGYALTKQKHLGNYCSVPQSFRSSVFMKATLIYLSHLENVDIEKRKLSNHLFGENWSWNKLNTINWERGSIFGSRMEEQDRRLLGIVIRALLNLCEITKRKHIQCAVVRHGWDRFVSDANNLVHTNIKACSIYYARRMFGQTKDVDLISWVGKCSLRLFINLLWRE